MGIRDNFGKGSAERSGFVKDVKLKTPEPGESATHLIARIVPPMKSLAGDTRGWARFVKIHYGHKGAGFKPGTSFTKTFECIEQKDYKHPDRPITVHCPKCDEISDHKAAKEAAEKRLEKTTDKAEQERLSTVVRDEKDWLWNNSLSMGWKMYVVEPGGNILRLQIGSKAKKGLDALITEAKAMGVSVLDLDHGMYIDFRRTGYGRDVVDTCTIAQTKLPNGGKVDWEAPLTDADLERIYDTCVDLNETENHLTAAEIQELVNCDQEPETVDAIFSRAKKRAAGSRYETNESTTSTEVKEQSQVVTTMAASPPSNAASAASSATSFKSVQTTTAPIAEDDEEAELERKLAEAKARKAATQKPKVAPTEVVGGETYDDDEAFFASL